MGDWGPPLIGLAGVIVAGCFTVWGSHLVSKRNARAVDKTADAAVQNAINSGFATLTEESRKHVEEVRIESAELKAEIVELRGWIRELIGHIDGLERILRAHNIDVPSRTHQHPLSQTTQSPGPSEATAN